MAESCVVGSWFPLCSGLSILLSPMVSVGLLTGMPMSKSLEPVNAGLSEEKVFADTANKLEMKNASCASSRWTLNPTTILDLVGGREETVRQRRRNVTIEQRWGDQL